MAFRSDFEEHDHLWAMKMVEGVKFYKKENDHVLKRQFRRLHLYNLYYKHARLVELDKEIEALEESVDEIKDKERGKPIPDIAEIAKGIDGFMENVDKAIREFDQASRQFQRSMTATEVPAYYRKHLQDVAPNGWKTQYKYGDGWSECTFQVAKPKGVIHSCVDRFEFLRMLFVKNPKEQRDALLYYSEGAVRTFEDITVNVSFGLLVLVPIVVLSFLHNKIEKLVLVLIFVLLSSIVATVLANVTHKNSIAVVAAYTAILVVFLSNNPGS